MNTSLTVFGTMADTKAAIAQMAFTDPYANFETARLHQSAGSNAKMEDNAATERRTRNYLSSLETSSNDTMKLTVFGNTASALMAFLASNASISCKSVRGENMYACMDPNVFQLMKLMAMVNILAIAIKRLIPSNSMQESTVSTQAQIFAQRVVNQEWVRETSHSASIMANAKVKWRRISRKSRMGCVDLSFATQTLTDFLQTPRLHLSTRLQGSSL